MAQYTIEDLEKRLKLIESYRDYRNIKKRTGKQDHDRSIAELDKLLEKQLTSDLNDLEMEINIAVDSFVCKDYGNKISLMEILLGYFGKDYGIMQLYYPIDKSVRFTERMINAIKDCSNYDLYELVRDETISELKTMIDKEDFSRFIKAGTNGPSYRGD